MVNIKKCVSVGFVIGLLTFSVTGSTDGEEIYRLRMFFGLSCPDGSAVSLYDWQVFEREKIAKEFQGFNVVDSTGYYKGKPERSKVVTVIVTDKDIQKARDLAKLFAKEFHQDSVMMVKVPVLEWSFVKAE